MQALKIRRSDFQVGLDEALFEVVNFFEAFVTFNAPFASPLGYTRS